MALPLNSPFLAGHIALGLLLIPALSHAEELDLLRLSLRAQVSEQTILGDDAPEDFEAYDVAAHFGLPWQRNYSPGWRLGTRLMASAGMLRGAGEEALTVSLIPELVLAPDDGWLTLDLGAGAALFSRHRFGSQDYGGPLQFALTVGLSVPLYKKLGLGYRYLHYSDASIYNSDTIGADLHMIELSYRF